MITFLIITSISVSIDSLVCGLSLSYLNGRKYLIVLIMTLTVFALCLIANYCASFLSNYLPDYFASFGGILLILIGVFGLFKKEKQTFSDSNIIKQSFFSGIAVGIDGAIANISLSLMGMNSFFVPLTIALCHTVFISFGVLIGKSPIANKFGKIDVMSPIILIILGTYKLLDFFI
ncbi:MAG: manganese efflux pump [Clostridia bacterium]|nr:manganese efflux pump [Clostridia bacterium]